MRRSGWIALAAGGWLAAGYTPPAVTAQQAEPNRMNQMDHGPFVSTTITLDPFTPRGVIAHKAIVVRVAPDATMAFDTDLLRVVGAWTGGLLHWYPARDGLQEWPTPDGFLHFTNDQRPGWTTGTFHDPRPWRYGPLPEGRRYNGLYLHGEQVVFSYTVGESDILELFGFDRVQGEPLFTRTLNLSPTSEGLSLHVLQAPQGRATTLERTMLAASHGYLRIQSGAETRLVGFQELPEEAEWRLQHGHLVLSLPALTEPLRFRIDIGPVRSTPDAGYLTAHLQEATAAVPELASLQEPGPALWQVVEIQGVQGDESGPFAVDEILLPTENPWNSHLRLSAVDFLSDGRAAVVSMSGDVWLVDGLGETLATVRWQRFATGLNQPLGLRVVNDQIHVAGRDQITRLHDLNGNGQADFYENFNNQVMAGPNYHEFVMNLEIDSRGNFYFGKGTPWPPEGPGGVPAEITPHHGVLFRVSPDGRELEVIATGMRNPNGMSIGPDDQIYYAENEGHWVPTSHVTRAREGGFHGFMPSAHREVVPQNEDYVKPVVWTPHFVDNSPAQPRVIANPHWPEELQGHLLLASYGRGTLALILVEEIEGQLQGGHLVLPFEFQSGLQQTRFHEDGHLYIVGMTNWQSTGHGGHPGSFHRVRYTGQPLRLPVALNTRPGGIELRFSEPLDPGVATDPSNYQLQQWTYAWNSSYGSRMGLFSVNHPGEIEPDEVEVRSVRLSADRRAVFLEIPGLEQPGPVGVRVPLLEELPRQIEASLGIVLGVDYQLRTADGAELDQVIHKTIHRVAAEPFDAAAR